MSVIFSRACEHALRGLIEMASHPEQKFWTIQELAERIDAPAPFLAKTFQWLVRARILNSTKGRGGGFSFARPMDEILLLDIVSIIDGAEVGRACALGLPECSDENPCAFHEHWKPIRNAIMDALSRQSLKELAEQ